MYPELVCQYQHHHYFFEAMCSWPSIKKLSWVSGLCLWLWAPHHRLKRSGRLCERQTLDYSGWLSSSQVRLGWRKPFWSESSWSILFFFFTDVFCSIAVNEYSMSLTWTAYSRCNTCGKYKTGMMWNDMVLYDLWKLQKYYRYKYTYIQL